MRAVLVVVANYSEEAGVRGGCFVNCDDVIQEIHGATPYPTLCDSNSAKDFERSADRTHAQEDRTAAGTSRPYCSTIKRWTNLGADSNGMLLAMLDDPQAVVCLVTLKVPGCAADRTDDENAIERGEVMSEQKESIAAIASGDSGGKVSRALAGSGYRGAPSSKRGDRSPEHQNRA